jgi:hypothetical protein
MEKTVLKKKKTKKYFEEVCCRGIVKNEKGGSYFRNTKKDQITESANQQGKVKH